jgi:hypothetical protein
MCSDLAPAAVGARFRLSDSTFDPSPLVARASLTAENIFLA